MMIELVYIDEQDSQANQVIRSAVASNQFTKDQVTYLEPASTLNETIEMILDCDCKVLITDYRLAEHRADVEFSGVDLINEFQSRFAKFPCFITTSFASEAINEDVDINMIFPKSDFLDRNDREASELPFFVRVRKKISDYESHVSNTLDLFNQLSSKARNEQLSAQETQELIRLDSLIESFYGNEYSVESHIKEKALAPFSQLIRKTEELVEKIEADLKSNPTNNRQA